MNKKLIFLLACGVLAINVFLLLAGSWSPIWDFVRSSGFGDVYNKYYIKYDGSNWIWHGGALLPSADTTQSIGKSNRRLKELYAKRITATKIVADTVQATVGGGGGGRNWTIDTVFVFTVPKDSVIGGMIVEISLPLSGADSLTWIYVGYTLQGINNGANVDRAWCITDTCKAAVYNNRNVDLQYTACVRKR